MAQGITLLKTLREMTVVEVFAIIEMSKKFPCKVEYAEELRSLDLHHTNKYLL
jgi:hypothetical protein